MTEEPKTAAEAGSSAPTLFVWARDNTARVLTLIREKLGPGDEWRARCKVCGSGERTLDLAETVISSRPDLVLVWHDCPECRVREALKLSGVPENLTHATLENWVVQVSADASVLVKAREFLANPVGFFVIASPEFGNGKSHVAAAILRETFETGFRSTAKVRFITQAEVLRGLRRKYDDSRAEDMVRSLSNVHFLALDDFGVSAGGRDEQPALYDILSDRYAEKRPTVLTMNLSPDQFRGAIGARMASRLREATFAWAEVRGPGFRSGNRKNYLKG